LLKTTESSLIDDRHDGEGTVTTSAALIAKLNKGNITAAVGRQNL